MPATEPTEWEFLQNFFGANEYLSRDEEGNFTAVPRITMGPPSIYDVKCGLDYAPGCASAADRWNEKITPHDVVAGVATWTWPTPTAMEESSIQLFTAALGTATVAIVIPLITDAAFLELEPRAHTLRLRVLNNSIPSLPTDFASPATGNFRIRYLPGVAAAAAPHGQIVEYELQTSGNDIAYVRAVRVLGDTVPPVWALVDEARASNASVVTQLSAASFNPFMYENEAMLLFMGRITGTAATPPADRGWVLSPDPDLTNGGVPNGSISNLRLAISTSRGPGVNGVVSGTNTMSNQQYLNATAWRGCLPTDIKSALSTGTTVAFPSFTGIAPGGFVLYMTQVQAAVGIVPDGGSVVGTDAPAAGGFNWRLRMVLPDENGNVAPPDITIAAAPVQIIAVRMEPN